MTSTAVTVRNRANAKKSTGPRTAAGKASVSGNARRHGATSQPDPASVAAWARVILDRPDLAPRDLLSDDRRVAAALALAEAEVRLVSARAALEEFESGDAALSEGVQQLQVCAENIRDELRFWPATARERRSGESLLRRILNVTLKDTARGGKRHLLLKRYVREARGHRRRAFEAWLDGAGWSDGFAEETT